MSRRTANQVRTTQVNHLLSRAQVLSAALKKTVGELTGQDYAVLHDELHKAELDTDELVRRLDSLHSYLRKAQTHASG